MNPVLSLLALGNPLQKDLGARAIFRQQALITPSGDAVLDVPQYTGPEFC